MTQREERGLNFACPACGKEYPWSAELAGKKGKCKCGNVWRVPADPPGSSAATKSAAMLARPMPSPKPVATSLHEDPSVDASVDASVDDGAPTSESNGDARATDSSKSKKSIGGKLRSLWPKSKKK
jgi:hypothetical protein